MNTEPIQWEQWAVPIVYWGGFVIAVLGGIKLVIYLIGEFCPNVFGQIKSEGLRKFLTGTGNRLVFGLGGFFTAGLGVIFMMAAKGLEALMERLY